MAYFNGKSVVIRCDLLLKLTYLQLSGVFSSKSTLRRRMRSACCKDQRSDIKDKDNRSEINDQRSHVRDQGSRIKDQRSISHRLSFWTLSLHGRDVARAECRRAATEARSGRWDWNKSILDTVGEGYGINRCTVVVLGLV